MTSAQSDAIRIATAHADEAHVRAHAFLVDTRNAETALGAIGSAAGYIDAIAECQRWRAIADTIRAVSL